MTITAGTKSVAATATGRAEAGTAEAGAPAARKPEGSLDGRTVKSAANENVHNDVAQRLLSKLSESVNRRLKYCERGNILRAGVTSYRLERAIRQYQAENKGTFNKKTPIKKHYMEKSGDVLEDAARLYFAKAGKSIIKISRERACNHVAFTLKKQLEILRHKDLKEEEYADAIATVLANLASDEDFSKLTELNELGKPCAGGYRLDSSIEKFTTDLKEYQEEVAGKEDPTETEEDRLDIRMIKAAAEETAKVEPGNTVGYKPPVDISVVRGEICTALESWLGSLRDMYGLEQKPVPHGPSRELIQRTPADDELMSYSGAPKALGDEEFYPPAAGSLIDLGLLAGKADVLMNTTPTAAGETDHIIVAHGTAMARSNVEESLIKVLKPASATLEAFDNLLAPFEQELSKTDFKKNAAKNIEERKNATNQSIEWLDKNINRTRQRFARANNGTDQEALAEISKRLYFVKAEVHEYFALDMQYDVSVGYPAAKKIAGNLREIANKLIKLDNAGYSVGTVRGQVVSPNSAPIKDRPAYESRTKRFFADMLAPFHEEVAQAAFQSDPDGQNAKRKAATASAFTWLDQRLGASIVALEGKLYNPYRRIQIFAASEIARKLEKEVEKYFQDGLDGTKGVLLEFPAARALANRILDLSDYLIQEGLITTAPPPKKVQTAGVPTTSQTIDSAPVAIDAVENTEVDRPLSQSEGSVVTMAVSDRRRSGYFAGARYLMSAAAAGLRKPYSRMRALLWAPQVTEARSPDGAMMPSNSKRKGSDGSVNSPISSNFTRKQSDGSDDFE